MGGLYFISILASLVAGFVLVVGLAASNGAPQEAAAAAAAAAIALIPYCLARSVEGMRNAAKRPPQTYAPPPPPPPAAPVVHQEKLEAYEGPESTDSKRGKGIEFWIGSGIVLLISALGLTVYLAGGWRDSKTAGYSAANSSTADSLDVPMVVTKESLCAQQQSDIFNSTSNMYGDASSEGIKVRKGEMVLLLKKLGPANQVRLKDGVGAGLTCFIAAKNMM